MKSKHEDVDWMSLTDDEKAALTRARELAYRRRELSKLVKVCETHLPEDHYLTQLTGADLEGGAITCIDIEIGKHANVSVLWDVQFGAVQFDDALDATYKWLRETFDFPYDVR